MSMPSQLAYGLATVSIVPGLIKVVVKEARVAGLDKLLAVYARVTVFACNNRFATTTTFCILNSVNIYLDSDCDSNKGERYRGGGGGKGRGKGKGGGRGKGRGTEVQGKYLCQSLNCDRGHRPP